MSADDPHWDVRPIKRPKRTKPSPKLAPPKTEPSDWKGPERPRAPRPARRWLVAVPYQNAGAAGVAVVAAAVALAAWIGRPSSAAVTGPLPTQPVEARIVLAAGDTRSLEDVCRAYDVPVRLCNLSRDCANAALATQAPSTRDGRVVRLILRSSQDSCAKQAGGPQAKAHRESGHR
jgi:hypothetical protein